MEAHHEYPRENYALNRGRRGRSFAGGRDSEFFQRQINCSRRRYYRTQTEKTLSSKPEQLLESFSFSFLQKNIIFY